MKFKKSRNRERMKEKPKTNNCWDIITQNFKKISESIESIGKSLNHIYSNSNMIKSECHNLGFKKNEKFIYDTFLN